jgi:hypothetical protein
LRIIASEAAFAISRRDFLEITKQKFFARDFNMMQSNEQRNPGLFA